MRFDGYMDGYEDEYQDEDDVVSSVVRPSEGDSKILRKCMIEEMEAINEYIERAGKVENDVVRKALLDIAEEERVHFGEFEMLLEATDPAHEESEDEGEEEIMDMIGDTE